ncbi:hypothetical protein [Pseudokineococcus sp. 1T1Z-3]|uniref:hypothetical protein n=1 Tax=Pseudokineococcus sp. 1T1Z-3 TaxID=3132745 RepID=UPI0030A16271
MVAELLALRLALWRGGLRRDTWRVVVLVLGGLWGLGLAAGVLVGLSALPTVPADVARGVVVAAGAVLVAGWTLVPLVAFGTDPSLDPARFATLPVAPRRLAVGLLAAALLGVPGVLSLLVGVGTVLAWAPRAGGLAAVGVALVAGVGGLTGVLTAVAAGRLATTAAAGVLGGRRGREVSAVVGVLGLLALGPTMASAGGVALALADPGAAVTRVLDVLAWTPLGLAWAAPADAAQGAWGSALARLGLAAAALVGLVLAWSVLLGRRLLAPRPTSGGRSGAARASTAGLLDRRDGVRWAVAQRCLRSWRRDPRYVVNGASALAVPAVLVVMSTAGALPSAMAWVVGPAAALVLGTVLHNDVAYDGPAFWTHLAAGVRGAEDRAGRAAALLLWAVPLVVVVTVAGALLAGADPLGREGAGRVAGVLAVSTGLLLAGTAASCVLSAVRPYPVQQPGENPFSQPPGAALPGALAQLLSLLATLVLALPAVGVGVLAAGALPVLGLPALVVAVGLGLLELRAGVRRGGALLDRRGPELLAAVRRDR